MGRPLRRILEFLCFAFLASALSVSCIEERKSVKIGFLGGLTGKAAEVGLMVRNAVTLYVEDVNRRGGIEGRTLELLAIDDKNDPQEALLAASEFKEKGISAVVGPVTNSVAAGLVPRLDEAGILFISPTVRLDRVSSKNDCFLRLRPSFSRSARFLGAAAASFGLKRLAPVIDYGNLLYGRDWVDHFSEAFTSDGGFMDTPVTFISSYQISFSSMADMILSRDPDGILLVTGPTDTALLCQHLRKRSYRGSIFASDWSVGASLAVPGGSSVEGIYFAESSVFGGKGDGASARFASDYFSRFGNSPSLSAYHGHDAAVVAVEGIRKAGLRASGREVKRSILATRHFAGLRGTFSVQDTVDGEETLHLYMVSEGGFKEIR